jgi:hypothetical protein
MFTIISDTLLIAGSLGLSIFCIQLTQRITKLSKLYTDAQINITNLEAEVERINNNEPGVNIEYERSTEILSSLIEDAKKYEAELAFLLAAKTPQEIETDEEKSENTEPSPSVNPVFFSRSTGAIR